MQNHYLKAGLLGIECGGTKTSAVFSPSSDFKDLESAEFGPANFFLTSECEWRDLLVRIRDAFPNPSGIGIAVAGAKSATEQDFLIGIAAEVFPGIPSRAGSDLDSALLSAGPLAGNRMVCVSGTGSACLASTGAGGKVTAGGFGHLLGDSGSGYSIGRRFLRLLALQSDLHHTTLPDLPELQQKVMHILNLDCWDQLIPFSVSASKCEIASVARICIESAQSGNRECLRLLESEAASLAGTANACLTKFHHNDPSSRSIEVITRGGIFSSSPVFRQHFIQTLESECRSIMDLQIPDRSVDSVAPTVFGALCMASTATAIQNPCLVDVVSDRPPSDASEMAKVFVPSLSQLGTSPTEKRNPASSHLDQMGILDAINIFLDEDRRLPDAIAPQAKEIAEIIKAVATAFSSGGRLIYSGAGTSGRLGILDASECPPTFKSPPDWVVGLIAGGHSAILKAVEGAEDSTEQGRGDVADLEVCEADVVVGIAASGRTPYVWGTLHEAAQRKAVTALITFNPYLEIPQSSRPDYLVAVDAGPEILTGSTRLKAGTATKMILNMITTISMVQIGKVVENLMVDLNPSNDKLKDRAVRITTQLLPDTVTPEVCRDLLESAQWDIKKVLTQYQVSGQN